MGWAGPSNVATLKPGSTLKPDSKSVADSGTPLNDPDAHLMDVVSRCVPTQVKPNLCFVRLVDHQLRITVDSAGSATRVRFAGSAIRAALQKREGLRVDRVTLHVKPREELMFLQRASTSRPDPVSRENVALIESTARSVSRVAGVAATQGTGEDPLAQALYRLAGVLKRRVEK